MSRFDEKAQEWDTPERQERAHEAAHVIRQHVPLGHELRVIDIGAGTGLLGLELAADVGNVVLAEPSSGMLAMARQKLAADGPANVSAVEYDIRSGPPKDGPFDLVVSLLVLHHVEDTRAALETMHAMLAPGGRIALLDLDAEDGTFHDDQEGIHHQGFDQGALVGLASAAGFLDVESRVVSDIDRDGKRFPVFLLTGQRG
jgi:ubiquinone/menaquinone biosynthesis C-methylase UbiE